VLVVSHAPVRIADLGGWTDTWFATSGAVSNVAVSPGVTVSLRSDSSLTANEIRLRSMGSVRIEQCSSPKEWHDDLLGSLFAETQGGLDVSIASAVPAGSGLGTSASVAVAVIAALDVLGDTERRHSQGGQGGQLTQLTQLTKLTKLDQLDIAHRAHQRETAAGRQSGVQDHAAAALGGVHRWAIDYPKFSAHDRLTDPDLLASLDQRLLPVYLGVPHSSSQLHEMVIREMESQTRNTDELLEPLRAAALAGHRALSVSDFAGYGQAMVACHEGQRRLHPDLISDLADHVVSSVALAGASGWKVNGAGGTGGSLTVLCGEDPANRRAILDVIAGINGAVVLDLTLDSTGVRVEKYS
jgi:D-glycero-alpha-D-manno-heptose-7-phosphate kinase